MHGKDTPWFHLRLLPLSCWCFCLPAMLLTGCTSVALRTAQDAYREGKVDDARAKIAAYARKQQVGNNRVIAHLELGNILRGCQDYAASNEAYLVADQAVEEFDGQPEFQISKEGLAALSNLNALPYRGFNYDRIMLSTYRALNYLQLGDLAAARVELRRAYERQRDAVARNAKRIEKMQAAVQEVEASPDAAQQTVYDTGKAQQDEKFKASIESQYGDLDGFAAYADYVNPFGELVQGLYFAAAGVDGNDHERARVSLRRLKGMVPENPYVGQDLDLAEQVAEGKPYPPMTYVIFATGTAPKRGQIRIDIPLFLLTKVDYVGVNFPRLIMNGDYLASLGVEAGGQSLQTVVVTDMDGVIAREFKNELPIVITKTLISAGTKALIAYGLKDATKDKGLAGIATRIGTTAYQALANQADLRTWATLPKQFQYARLPNPADGKLVISASGQAPVSCTVDPAAVNVIWVRSINAQSPLITSQFILKGRVQCP